MSYARRIAALFLALLCTAGALSCHAAGPSVSAAAYVLMDADSGRVLLAENAERELPVASTTKIMTALVALQDGDLTKVCTVRQEHLARGSSMYLAAGETLTLEDLLYGLLLSSGNDAAECIADNCGGRASFIRRMNDTAAALGMTHTSFANPSGLDEAGHYSCALDMARLMTAAMRDPVFARIASTATASAAARSMTNHNRLLNAAVGCVGGKTGYTDAAGRTLVTCAEREGLRLVAVTLHDRNDWNDHEALYDYGFSTYRREILLARGSACAVVPVRGGGVSFVALKVADTLSCALAEGETAELCFALEETAAAPVRAGEKLGEAIVRVDGAELGRVPLTAANDVTIAAVKASGFRMRG